MDTSEGQVSQDNRLEKAQKLLSDCPAINFKGKPYVMVKDRLNIFRAVYGTEYQIHTEPLVDCWQENIVVVKAGIIDNHGRLVATGIAEEDRSKGQINRTSALENCETSAIGRALANFGLSGGEFASADELANAVHQQSTPDDRERTAIQTEPTKADLGMDMDMPDMGDGMPEERGAAVTSSDPLAGLDMDD